MNDNDANADWLDFLDQKAVEAAALFESTSHRRIGKRSASTKPSHRKAQPYPKFRRQAHRARK